MIFFFQVNVFLSSRKNEGWFGMNLHLQFDICVNSFNYK